MTCLKPGDTDCTSVGDCTTGDCGAGTTPDPVLPACNNTFPDGTYAYATITVENGCIKTITAGEPPVYTPDDCCGGTGGGGGGSGSGARGPKGDTGAAATVNVDPVVAQGTGASWSVENTGSSSAAVFKFTAPAATGGGGGSSTTGYTGELNGFEWQAGLTKAVPDDIITKVTARESSPASGLITTFQASPDIDNPNGGVLIELNLTAAKTYIDGKTNALGERIDDLTAAVAEIATRVEALEGGDTSALSPYFLIDPITGRAYNPGTQDVTVTVIGPNNQPTTTVVPAGGIADLPTWNTAGLDLWKNATVNGVGVGVYNAGGQNPGS